ncbi:MAG: hypothetical protein ABS918_12605, partial [Saccharopolyspora rectivirgula]
MRGSGLPQRWSQQLELREVTGNPAGEVLAGPSPHQAGYRFAQAGRAGGWGLGPASTSPAG